jgi:hypothetical protein
VLSCGAGVEAAERARRRADLGLRVVAEVVCGDRRSGLPPGMLRRRSDDDMSNWTMSVAADAAKPPIDRQNELELERAVWPPTWSNNTFDRTAAAHSLAAAGQREG